MSWLPIVLEIVSALIKNCDNDDDQVTAMVYDESPLVRKYVNRAMRRAGVPWRERREVRDATLERIGEAEKFEIRAFCGGGGLKAVNAVKNRTVETSDNGSSRIPVGV